MVVAPQPEPAAAATAIQRLIRKDSPTHRSRHLLLTVADAGAARRFVAALAPRVSTTTLADPQGGAVPLLSVGFSYRGLAALGLPALLLDAFRKHAPAFAEGAWARAAQRLVDSGASAAAHWDPAYRPQSAHLLLNLHADREADLVATTAALQTLDGAAGLAGWQQPLAAAHLGRTRARRSEHFGFVDGVSRLPIRWTAQGPEGGHSLGNFLLGYPNDGGFDLWRLAARPELAAFLRHGSFGALRQMEQDVADFRTFVAAQSQALAASPDYVMAKLCGRWPNGMPLLPGQTTAPPVAGDPITNDAFDFRADPRGEGCPFGAHIRRMNPRADPIVPSARRRPLIRRGMPYGAQWSQATAAQPRGLLGLFFCASLEDQFEHLLAEWGDLNPMGPDNRGRARDPLIGQHNSDGARLELPMAGAPSRWIGGLRSFTKTRGTLYAFYPGAAGLAALPGLLGP